MRSTHSPTIRSRYDYYYAISPPSSATNYYDNHGGSLFGDPVPPPPAGFLENLDTYLYGNVRRGSSAMASTSTFSHHPASQHQLSEFSASDFRRASASNLTESEITSDARRFSDFSEERPAPRQIASATIHTSSSSSDHLFGQSTGVPGEGLRSPSEWLSYKTAAEEWRSSFPRAQSARNVSEVNHGSAMTALILPDTTSSSSGAATHVENTPEPRRQSTDLLINIPDTQIASATSSDNASDGGEGEKDQEIPPKQTNGIISPSPAIITDKITTGPYRIPATRSGTKRSAFAIITQLSPNISRPDSPDGPLSGRLSPFRGYGFREFSSRSSSGATSPPRTAKSLENFLQPQNSIYGARRPSFDILDSLPREMESYQISTDVRHKTMIQIASGSTTPRYDFRNRSYEALDRAPRARSGLSASESMRHLDRPILRRRSSSGSSTRLPMRSRSSLQRGVVRVMSQSAVGSPSRIPRPRTSIGSSMDDLLSSRRESSVSPIRRGSISRTSSSRRSARRQSSVTLLPAVTLIPDEPSTFRARSSRSPRRPGVLKVTPLSPIIGTPNREPECTEGDPLDDGKVTMSPSKIPVRSASTTRPISRSNTTLGVGVSQKQSQGSPSATSRDASPGKTSPKSASKTPSAKKLQKPPVKCHEGKKVSSALTKKPPIGTQPAEGRGKIGEKEKAVSKTTRKIETVSKVRKTDSATEAKRPVRKTPSFAKKDAGATTNGGVKKEPASTRKELSQAKKEPSSARQESSTATKESRGRISRENSGLIKGKPPGKLEKKPSFRTDKTAVAKVEEQDSIDSLDSGQREKSESPDKFQKLIPLTKPNVVSMTTAAIASQPVQITTTVTNQLSMPKMSDEVESKDNLPAAILEKSQKTLETIQKTVNEATEEIHKTITENLTDLKSLEQDIQKAGEMAKEDGVKEKPTMMKQESAKKLQEVSERIAAETGVVGKLTQDGKKTPVGSLSKQPSIQTLLKSPIPEASAEVENNNNEPLKEAMPPVEPTVSVIEANNNNLPSAENINNNNNLSESGASEEKVSERAISALPEVELESGNFQQKSPPILPEVTSQKHQSPEGKSTSENGSPGDAAAEEGEVAAKNGESGCCRCATCCLPCRKSTCCRKQPKEPPRDTAETVNEKGSRWNCCKRKKKDQEAKDVKEKKVKKEKAKKVEKAAKGEEDPDKKSQNCCKACFQRILCCRSTNKVDNSRQRILEPDQQPPKKTSRCCACLPCCRRDRKKSDTSTASTWAERQPSEAGTMEKQPGCCSRFWRCLCCCCCRRKEVPESRRTSLNSKKASIAPPPVEEKKKLDLSLVEHSSLMKAAIPVMHICLAWFCLMCNCLVPGLGTIFSGLFCLCFGTPRFSQHDGFRARIGTFVINILVGVSQAFTVLFCLVGWGWSIWWGTIMIRLARKRKKLRRAQRDEEAAEAATISSRSQAPPVIPAGASPAAGVATDGATATPANHDT
ncbi:hypothetical protein DMENIID0001_055620 [Sergentomyia squamirostris]